MTILLLATSRSDFWSIKVDGYETFCGSLEKVGDRFRLRRFYDVDAMLTPSQVAPKMKETWLMAEDFQVVSKDGMRRPMKGL